MKKKEASKRNVYYWFSFYVERGCAKDRHVPFQTLSNDFVFYFQIILLSFFTMSRCLTVHVIIIDRYYL